MQLAIHRLQASAARRCSRTPMAATTPSSVGSRAAEGSALLSPRRVGRPAWRRAMPARTRSVPSPTSPWTLTKTPALRYVNGSPGGRRRQMSSSSPLALGSWATRSRPPRRTSSASHHRCSTTSTPTASCQSGVPLPPTGVARDGVVGPGLSAARRVPGQQRRLPEHVRVRPRDRAGQLRHRQGVGGARKAQASVVSGSSTRV